MRAVLENLPILEHHDLVGVAHSGCPMSNQDGGSAAHYIAQSAEDFFFGLGVYSGQGIVQNQNSRITNDSASDGGTLLLSAREGNAAFSDHSFVLIGEVGHVAFKVGNFRGAAHFFRVVFLHAESDVATYRLGEKVGVLRDESDGAPQSLERPFADAAAINQNFPFGRLPQAGDQGGQSGFAGPRGPDNCQCGAGGNFEIDIFQYRLGDTRGGSV